MRSIPTRDTRTHGSMTIPLSRTRSRTSIRLVPPAAPSTGLGHSLCRSFFCLSLRLTTRPRCAATRQRGKLPLQRAHLLAQVVVLGGQHLLARREMVIVFPPVETDLLG